MQAPFDRPLPDPPLPEHGYDSALRHYEAGRLDAAALVLRDFLAARPDHLPGLNLRAVIAIRAGNGPEAETLLRRMIALDPGYFDAHNNLGVLLQNTGRLGEAETAFRTAIGLNPRDASARFNLGFLLQATGRLDEAETAYWLAIRLKPDHAEAHGHLGAILQATGRPEYAETAYRTAIRINPEYLDAHNSLGVLLGGLGRREEAEAAYRAVLRLDPVHANAANNLAILLMSGNRWEEAETLLRKLLENQPDHPDALNSLGNVLNRTARLGDAEAAYRRALQLRPEFAEAANNLGNLLRHDGRFDEAEASFRQALRANPGYVDGYNNYGGLLQDLGRYEEAETAFRTALRIDPRHAGARLNLGVLLSTFGYLAEAEAECRTILDNDPGLADAHVLWGLMDLLRGNFASGWAHYEQRWRGVFKPVQRHYAQPEWDGRPFPGQTLLIHGEQGLGDKIQFARYLPLLARLGGRVVLECAPPLCRLLGTVPGVAEVVREGDPPPDFDRHCSLMSLPFLFDTRLETIPADVPYLAVPDEALAAAPDLGASAQAPLKVGLCWAGSAEHKNDRFRSLPFGALEPLFAVPGITWVILQKERRPEGFEALARERGWLDPMAGVGDFADTAALIRQLDLVVAVDTAVVHLAGALGKPAWVLLPAVPDWRWLLDRDDSPWYPSLRLFRQKTMGDWPELVGRVAEALDEWAAAAPTRGGSA